MRFPSVLVFLCACGGALRNAPPEPLGSSVVPPGFDRFHSSTIHQSIDIDASGASQRMTLFLHDRGGRISFGTVSSAEQSGAMAYAMQFLRLPTEAIDAVLVDRSLCVLRTDAKILCAELEAHRKTEIPVDPTSTRLLSLGNDVICAMRAAGDFACFK